MVSTYSETSSTIPEWDESIGISYALKSLTGDGQIGVESGRSVADTGADTNTAKNRMHTAKNFTFEDFVFILTPECQSMELDTLKNVLIVNVLNRLSKV